MKEVAVAFHGYCLLCAIVSSKRGDFCADLGPYEPPYDQVDTSDREVQTDYEEVVVVVAAAADAAADAAELDGVGLDCEEKADCAACRG